MLFMDIVLVFFSVVQCSPRRLSGTLRVTPFSPTSDTLPAVGRVFAIANQIVKANPRGACQETLVGQYETHLPGKLEAFLILFPGRESSTEQRNITRGHDSTQANMKHLLGAIKESLSEYLYYEWDKLVNRKRLRSLSVRKAPPDTQPTHRPSSSC